MGWHRARVSHVLVNVNRTKENCRNEDLGVIFDVDYDETHYSARFPVIIRRFKGFGSGRSRGRRLNVRFFAQFEQCVQKKNKSCGSVDEKFLCPAVALMTYLMHRQNI